MIRLGKNKVDERFNILADGTIVDLNGTPQHLYEHNGWLLFYKCKVHQIQMWTNFGWRDGKVWAIHHLDENKFNNSLTNLVFLTHSEHSKLHHKGKKYKIHRKKNQSYNVGKVWINNGIENKFVLPNEIPNGFVRGRKK